MPGKQDWGCWQMIITLDEIRALTPPPNAPKILRAIYFLACGGVLTARIAIEEFELSALHSTMDDARSVGLKINGARINPSKPPHKYWMEENEEALAIAYRHLVANGCDSKQTPLLDGNL
ncbi:hypothetical protein [Zhongshania sp.]|jgi:hypothetical protein|uniref:hypothetical protein n=1 Tax=Zhongshania sp. TaxID=1971902 RepID=UPI002A8397DC|nr:hypothetical protein [Zhongshania sp.]